LRDDQARLEDILRAIGLIERYARRGRSSFDDDELLQAWMLHHLTVIGEAAVRLSLALREGHPEVSWSGIIGMRNVLVHGYFSIDLEEVWRTVERGVPALREQIEAILRELGPGGPPAISEHLRPYLLVTCRVP
jgi:uncharacterized protein with HEPN domain